MSGLNETDVGYAVQTLIADYLAGNVHTAMPGLVEAVNNDDNTVDVLPLLKKSTSDGVQTECKIIPRVRYLMNANSSVSVTLNTGDIVLLIFCEEILDNFDTSGKTANTSFNRKFDLSSAIAIPLLFTSESNNLLALMTEAYKTALQNYLSAIQLFMITTSTATTAAQIAAAAGVLVAPGAFPSGFIAPTDSLTQKVKAV